MTCQAREALEEVVPGNWFLVEGTLTSSLRWGEVTGIRIVKVVKRTLWTAT